MKTYKNITINNANNMAHADLLDAVKTAIETQYSLTGESIAIVADLMIRHDEDIIEIDGQFYPASEAPDQDQTNDGDHVLVNLSSYSWQDDDGDWHDFSDNQDQDQDQAAGQSKIKYRVDFYDGCFEFEVHAGTEWDEVLKIAVQEAADRDIEADDISIPVEIKEDNDDNQDHADEPRFTGYRLVILEGNAEPDESKKYRDYVAKNYPEIEIDYRANTSGNGGGLFDSDGLPADDQIDLWGEYCNAPYDDDQSQGQADEPETEYYGNFRTAEGNYNSVPFKFADKKEAIKSMKKIARGNCRPKSKVAWSVFDEQSKIIASGSVYNRAKTKSKTKK